MLEEIRLGGEMESFVEYLMSIEYRWLMERNRMSMHIERGKIFFENQNGAESIYDFIYAQQNYQKKTY